MTEGPHRVLRVVQWTTGNVAAEVVKALLPRPHVELVGAYAYSLDKVGKDVVATYAELPAISARLLA